MLSQVSQYGFMLFCYSMFLLAITTSHKNGSRHLKDVLSGKGEAGTLFMQLIAGIFFLGIGAAIIYVNSQLDDAIFIPSWNDLDNLPVWILTTAAAIIGILSTRKIIPVVNSSSFFPFHLPLFFMPIRTLFLIVYELFFRGVTLFIMMEDFGVAIAIAINQVLYVMAHWFDKRERYGSVLMGVILCLVTIYYQNVWPAIVIHLSLALSHEITLLINNRSLIKKSWL